MQYVGGKSECIGERGAIGVIVEDKRAEGNNLRDEVDKVEHEKVK